MRRAAWNKQIYRHQPTGPVVDLCMAGIRSAGDGAGAHRNDQLGSGDRLIGFEQSQAHVLRHRASNQ